MSVTADYATTAGPSSPHTPLPPAVEHEAGAGAAVGPTTPSGDSAQWSTFYMNRFMNRC